MTKAIKPRVDYYSVSWRGPDVSPALDKRGRPHRYAGKGVCHRKEFRPSQFKRAIELAREMRKADGVTEVAFRSAEIVGRDIGFPMAFMSDLAFD